MVVDDPEDARLLIVATLVEAGFSVKTASNGLEALIIAHDWHPGVIVMDLNMPVLDGIEAARLIKAAPTTTDARVVAHTARSAPLADDLQQLFSAVVPKLCTPDQLLVAVRAAARR